MDDSAALLQSIAIPLVWINTIFPGFNPIVQDRSEHSGTRLVKRLDLRLKIYPKTDARGRA
jgi:hypothetical protein